MACTSTSMSYEERKGTSSEIWRGSNGLYFRFPSLVMDTSRLKPFSRELSNLGNLVRRSTSRLYATPARRFQGWPCQVQPPVLISEQDINSRLERFQSQFLGHVAQSLGSYFTTVVFSSSEFGLSPVLFLLAVPLLVHGRARRTDRWRYQL